MTVLLIILLVAFVSGAPLFTIMLGGAALGSYDLISNAKSWDNNFDLAIQSMIGQGTGDAASSLSTIPMFIYAGYLLAEAKTADRLVRFANALLGWVPGGLAIVTIGTCALFTVFTGASGVTIIALGGLLMPALVKHGYPDKFSLGLIAGTGSVGLLFPPALPLFIYGTVYGLTRLHPDTWETKRFLFAGIVPGLVLVGMLSAVAVTVAVVKKLPRQKFEIRELGKSFVAVLPELAIPFLVIAGLFVFNLYGVAALTVVYVIVLEWLVLRQIKWQTMWRVSGEALAMVGAIFIIIFASIALTNYMVTAKVPDALIDWTREHVDSKIVFLLAINGILLLVGTVMDIFSAIVVVVPLVAPIAKQYGVDPYHLGVIFLLNLEVGYLHPPVGLNLFITSVKFQRPITEVMWATVPFLITMIVALLTITYVPSLTVVPEQERRGNFSNLQRIVHAAYEESRAVKEVPLVTFEGKPVLDKAGTQVVQKLDDCSKISLATPEATENAQDNCKNLFSDVSRCQRENPADPKKCEADKISEWIVTNLPVITVFEAALADADSKPILDKDKKPIVKKVEECDAIESEFDRDTCKELFVDVSKCHIRPEVGTTEECAREKIAEWADANVETDEEE
jgi:tripartite ATP-independent transporter DctM subunit